MRTILLPALLLTLFFSTELFGFPDSLSGKYEIVPAQEGERCVVCGNPLSLDDIALIVKGRRVPLKKEMMQEFLANEEKYFVEMQPRGALFQEDSGLKTGTSLGGVGWGWFLFGVYVLAGLLSSGFSGNTALQRGLNPRPYFFLGFFLPVLGYLIVLSRKSEPQQDLPHGLVKIPETSKPIACPACGFTNHPTARTCSGCKKPLSPLRASEASQVL